MTEQQLISKYIDEKAPVEIIFTNESGTWLWSVQVAGSNFWLDAFSDKDLAINFCMTNKLPIESIDAA